MTAPTATLIAKKNNEVSQPKATAEKPPDGTTSVSRIVSASFVDSFQAPSMERRMRRGKESLVALPEAPSA
ncbi:MAG: hypothetical protein CMJ89_00740 [Planctomycetes bacterium]|nr:hypothetical protein [Planctomycetota bacterium]